MGRELKIAVFAVLLIAATYYFGGTCERIGQGYELVFQPSRDALHLALRFFLALGAVAVTAGLVAALVRPLTVSFAVFGLSALAMLLGWELKASGGLLTAAYFIASLVYADKVARELNNRLRFSLRPISQSQGVLLTSLVIVACGSFYFGYAGEIEREGFSIPPALVEMVADRMEEQVGELIPADFGGAAVAEFRTQFEEVMDEVEGKVRDRLPAGVGDAVMAEFRNQFDAVLDEMQREAVEGLQAGQRQALKAKFRAQFEATLVELLENAIKPYEQWIPLVFAISLFSLLMTITALLSWIPVVALMAIFPLLTALGVTEVVAETGLIRRLTLG